MYVCTYTFACLFIFILSQDLAKFPGLGLNLPVLVSHNAAIIDVQLSCPAWNDSYELHVYKITKAVKFKLLASIYLIDTVSQSETDAKSINTVLT